MAPRAEHITVWSSISALQSSPLTRLHRREGPLAGLPRVLLA